MRGRSNEGPATGSALTPTVEFSSEWALQGLLLCAVVAAVFSGLVALSAAGL